MTYACVGKKKGVKNDSGRNEISKEKTKWDTERNDRGKRRNREMATELLLGMY